MIEVKINSTKNELSLKHDMCCEEHLTDELTAVIDILVADYMVKTGRNKNLTTEEKEQKLLEKRRELLDLIGEKPCTCKGYLNTDETHIANEL